MALPNPSPTNQAELETAKENFSLVTMRRKMLEQAVREDKNKKIDASKGFAEVKLDLIKKNIKEVQERTLGEVSKIDNEISSLNSRVSQTQSDTLKNIQNLKKVSLESIKELSESSSGRFSQISDELDSLKSDMIIAFNSLKVSLKVDDKVEKARERSDTKIKSLEEKKKKDILTARKAFTQSTSLTPEKKQELRDERDAKISSIKESYTTKIKEKKEEYKAFIKEVKAAAKIETKGFTEKELESFNKKLAKEISKEESSMTARVKKLEKDQKDAIKIQRGIFKKKFESKPPTKTQIKEQEKFLRQIEEAYEEQKIEILKRQQEDIKKIFDGLEKKFSPKKKAFETKVKDLEAELSDIPDNLEKDIEQITIETENAIKAITDSSDTIISSLNERISELEEGKQVLEEQEKIAKEAELRSLRDQKKKVMAERDAEIEAARESARKDMDKISKSTIEARQELQNQIKDLSTGSKKAKKEDQKGSLAENIAEFDPIAGATVGLFQKFFMRKKSEDIETEQKVSEKSEDIETSSKIPDDKSVLTTVERKKKDEGGLAENIAEFDPIAGSIAGLLKKLINSTENKINRSFPTSGSFNPKISNVDIAKAIEGVPQSETITSSIGQMIESNNRLQDNPEQVEVTNSDWDTSFDVIQNKVDQIVSSLQFLTFKMKENEMEAKNRGNVEDIFKSSMEDFIEKMNKDGQKKDGEDGGTTIIPIFGAGGLGKAAGKIGTKAAGILSKARPLIGGLLSKGAALGRAATPAGLVATAGVAGYSGFRNRFFLNDKDSENLKKAQTEYQKIVARAEDPTKINKLEEIERIIEKYDLPNNSSIWSKIEFAGRDKDSPVYKEEKLKIEKEQKLKDLRASMVNEDGVVPDNRMTDFRRASMEIEKDFEASVQKIRVPENKESKRTSTGRNGRSVSDTATSVKTESDGGLSSFTPSGSMNSIKLADASVDVDGLNPYVKNNLMMMAEEYEAMTGKKLQINSAYRSIKKQQELWDAASPADRGTKVAKPGRSMHQYGFAFDLQSMQAGELDKMGLLSKYGFSRPVRGEAWHVEPRGLNKEAARKGIFSADMPISQNPNIGSEQTQSGSMSYSGEVAPEVNMKESKNFFNMSLEEQNELLKNRSLDVKKEELDKKYRDATGNISPENQKKYDDELNSFQESMKDMSGKSIYLNDSDSKNKSIEVIDRSETIKNSSGKNVQMKETLDEMKATPKKAPQGPVVLNNTQAQPDRKSSGRNNTSGKRGAKIIAPDPTLMRINEENQTLARL